MHSSDQLAIEGNLFPNARAIFEDRPKFPWHRDELKRYTAAFPNSSQAIAVDVLWTIRSLASRDRIMDAWCRALGLPFSGPWEIELEEPVAHKLLGETRPTQLDAVARSPSGVLIIECKFTEEDGGTCSQWRPLGRKSPNAGMVQCSGHYEPQTNPVNGKTARCALTGKGIRYWDVVPKVLDFDTDAIYGPCPFKGGWFQWMRNLVVAHEMGRAEQLPAAFVVLYADGPFPMARKILDNDDWRSLAAKASNRDIPLRTASYQSLVTIASASASEEDRATIQALGSWMDNKLKKAASQSGGNPAN